LQETLRRIVKVWPSEFSAATANADQIPAEQLREDLAAVHTADGFYIGTEHGLAIGDHGQCFHSGRRQSQVAGDVLQAPQPFGELGPGHQLETAAYLFTAERPSGLVEEVIQLAHQCTRFGCIRQVGVLT
jgi:hypothetical protein